MPEKTTTHSIADDFVTVRRALRASSYKTGSGQDHEWLAAPDALRRIEEQFDALKLAATRQLTPLDVAATHIDILRRNSEDYDAKGRDNVALIVEQHVNEARKALFDAISTPTSTSAAREGGEGV